MPWEAWYWPNWQSIQVSSICLVFVEYLPALHINIQKKLKKWVNNYKNRTKKDLGKTYMHAVQSVDKTSPVAGPYLPCGQSLHVFWSMAAKSEYFPRSHSKQLSLETEANETVYFPVPHSLHHMFGFTLWSFLLLDRIKKVFQVNNQCFQNNIAFHMC